MLQLFWSVVERLKVLLATAAAQELEADFLLRHAQRKAELLRQAQAFEQEGLTAVAQELRQRAEDLYTHRPLASAQATSEFLATTAPALPEPAASREDQARKAGRSSRSQAEQEDRS